jgi:hypothetical protein
MPSGRSPKADKNPFYVVTPEWETSRALHARMIEILPEQHAIALAAYHEDIDTFTPFLRNRRRLRRPTACADNSPSFRFVRKTETQING